MKKTQSSYCDLYTELHGRQNFTSLLDDDYVKMIESGCDVGCSEIGSSMQRLNRKRVRERERERAREGMEESVHCHGPSGIDFTCGSCVSVCTTNLTCSF